MAVVGGLGVLASYATLAPAPARAPAIWPSASRISREPAAADLVVFVHPRCPCSSATLSELGRIMARAPGRCRVTIAMFAPTTLEPSWGETSLRRRAMGVEGARVIDDFDAGEAGLFGAARSGHVVVYGPAGDLWFAGGITASRGHEGDNLGEDCVIAALLGKTPSFRSTPTFGCEIAPAGEPECPLCAEESEP